MRGIYCSTEFLEKQNKEIQELKDIIANKDISLDWYKAKMNFQTDLIKDYIKRIRHLSNELAECKLSSNNTQKKNYVVKHKPAKDYFKTLKEQIMEDINNVSLEKAKEALIKVLDVIFDDRYDADGEHKSCRGASESRICHCESSEREGISEEDCNKGGDVGERR